MQFIFTTYKVEAIDFASKIGLYHLILGLLRTT